MISLPAARRAKGAWWPPRSSKPSSARSAGRGAFDSRPLRLTALSSCAGCAAKLGQEALREVMRLLPAAPADANLLIGTATGDDAAVYRLTPRLALVQTVDFFTPIVDEPFAYGRISATNAISDVYAMGGRPITALNIVGIPADLLPAPVIAEILRGGQAAASANGCSIVGGHTIRLPEPVYGMAVTGLVNPRRVIANSGARPGDRLILTKPIGTGIVTTGIRKGLASASAKAKAVASMCTANSPGAELAERGWVRAGTDVTGFGLLGHLGNLCRESGVAAEIDPRAIPVLSPEVLRLIARDCVPGGTRTNLETANGFTDWNDTPEPLRILAADAQTSGGLLLCVPEKRLGEVLRLLESSGALAQAEIGRIVKAPRPHIRMVRHAR